MLKRVITTLAIVSLICCFSLSAQMTAGTITLEIVDISSDNPQVAAMSEGLKGSQSIVTFQEGSSVMDIDMMGGMIKVKQKIDADKNMDLLMDMSVMGQKIWVQSNEMDRKKAMIGQEDPFEYTEVSYDKEDVKTIAGYDCYKMKVLFPDADDAQVEAYITDQIKTNAILANGMLDLSKYEGFPLELNVSNPTITTKMVAQSVSPDISDGAFEVNTEGFQKLTYTEFLELLKGMGMGF